MTTIGRIYATLLPAMQAHGIEDNKQNRIYALQGFMEALDAQLDERPEYVMLKVDVVIEIAMLKLEITAGKH